MTEGNCIRTLLPICDGPAPGQLVLQDILFAAVD